MRRLTRASILCLPALFSLSLAFADDNGNGKDKSDDKPATGRESGPIGQAKPGGGASTNGIRYHGGPVLLGTTHAYFIWYGNWGTNSAINILHDMVNGLSGSPYFNINTTYYNSAGSHVSNSVSIPAVTTDSGSRGTNLNDSAIATIVNGALTSNRLPTDTNGVYFVLTAPGVNETSGFCTQYCGWHTHGTLNGKDIKYAFVGSPANCPSACSVSNGIGPNGNSNADAMASILAHELEESVTDPDLNAWYDQRGQENADKCAWTFGAEYTAANGTKANMKLAGRDFLIQQNWVDASGGYCALKF